MTPRFVVQSSVAILLSVAGFAQPALSQVGDIGVRLHGGLIVPTGAYGDYFRLGPSVGVDAAYPLNERLDLKLDLDMDWVQTTPTYPTPDTNLWRYRLGLDAFLVGTRSSVAAIQGHAAAGFTTSRSKDFWLRSQENYEYRGLTLNETALTATGGFRFGLRTPDGLHWWLTTKLNWSPVNEQHRAYLRELARDELGPLGSALGLAITLGVNLF